MCQIFQGEEFQNSKLQAAMQTWNKSENANIFFPYIVAN